MKRLLLQGLVLMCLAGCARPEAAEPVVVAPAPPAPVQPAVVPPPSEPAPPAPAQPAVAPPPSEPASPAPAPPARGPRCGLATCAADQFCEDRFKGHRVDREGRPLEHQKCMPLPEPCRAAPSCACVKKFVAATHCRDRDGRITLDDFPR